MPQLTANLVSRPPFIPTMPLTRREFQQAADSGHLKDAAHLELIDGKVFTRVTQNGPHSTASQLVEDAMRLVLPAGYILRVQKPLAIDDRNQPEPDVAIVRGTAREFRIDHPTTATLVVEIAYRSLLGDRGAKAGLYARAGVSEYWILNLRDESLEVHREPAPDPTARFGARYLHKRSLSRLEEVSPLFAPTVRLLVEDLLP